MGQLILDISMSLDGFVAGPDQTLDDPLGKGGETLHEWAFATEGWQRSHGRDRGERNVDSEVVEQHLARHGATVMGRRMFSGGKGPWESDPKAGGGGATSRPSGIRSSCCPITRASRSR